MASIVIDVDPESNMFCCMVCQEIIQSAEDHRQCMSTDGKSCGRAICAPCVSNLEKYECPICRDTAKNGAFMINSIIAKEIYPKISKKCTLCNSLFLTEDGHMETCESRPIDCPCCDSTISISDIHTHLKSECSIPWVLSNPVHGLEYSGMIREYCSLDVNEKCIDHTIKQIDMNAVNELPAYKNKKVIYMWRTVEDPTNVQLLCVQLSAQSSESQEINMGDAPPVMIPINSFSNWAGPTMVPVADLVTSTLPESPHILIVSEHYKVMTGEEKNPMTHPDIMNFRDIREFRGKLLEILWGPPRGVFVNHHGQTHISNLYPDDLKRIEVCEETRPGQFQIRNIFAQPPPGINRDDLINLVLRSVRMMPDFDILMNAPNQPQEAKNEPAQGSGEPADDHGGEDMDDDEPPELENDAEPAASPAMPLSQEELDRNFALSMEYLDAFTARSWF